MSEIEKKPDAPEPDVELDDEDLDKAVGGGRRLTDITDGTSNTVLTGEH